MLSLSKLALSFSSLQETLSCKWSCHWSSGLLHGHLHWESAFQGNPVNKNWLLKIEGAETLRKQDHRVKSITDLQTETCLGEPHVLRVHKAGKP